MKAFAYIGTFLLINIIFQNFAMLKLVKAVNYMPIFTNMALFHSGNTYIFSPLTFFKAAVNYGHLIPTIIKPSLIISLVGFLFSLGTLFLIKKCFTEEMLTSSGSAHWAKRKDIVKNLVSPYKQKQGNGVICGVWYSGINYEKLYNFIHNLTGKNQKRTFYILSVFEALNLTKREYIIDSLPAHTFLCAPSRAGKGIGIIIPTLLYYKDSVIVSDLKRENLAKTGSYRKNVLGHEVIEFAPTDDRPTFRFNPLNEIRWGTKNEGRDVENLVSILIEEGKDPHWSNNARDITIGVITHLKYKHARLNMLRGLSPGMPGYIETNFAHVLEFMTKPRDADDEICSFQEQLDAEMHNSSCHFPAEIYIPNKTSDLPYLLMDITEDKAKEITIFTEDARNHPEQHPVVMSKFSSFMSKPDKEAGSILSTAITSLNIFAEKNISDNTSTSDFILGDLRGKKNPTDLFLVMPPNDVERAGKLFKIIVEFIVQRALENEAKAQKQHKCLILMDEFPAFGRMQNFIRSSGYVASYGIKILFVVQGLEQINTTYKNYEILTNCHVQIYMSPKDKITPEHLSKLFDNATEIVKQESRSAGLFTTANITKIEKARPLLTAGETMKLGNDVVMLFDGETIKSPKNKWFISDDMVFKMDQGKAADLDKKIGFRPERLQRK